MAFFPSYAKHEINDLTLVLDNYIQHRTGLTFAQPIKKNGKVTMFWKICCFIHINKSVSRVDVVRHFFGDKANWKGYYCNVFAALRECGLIEYSTKTKKLSVGPKFEEYRQVLCKMQGALV